MQRGRIELRGTRWLLRYRETVIENGKPVTRQKAVTVARKNKEFRTERDVAHLAEKILAPINARTAVPQSVDTVTHFIEKVYLPHVRDSLRPVTAKGYADMYAVMEPYFGDVKLCDFRTKHTQAILNGLAASKPRAVSSLRRYKNFLRGVFRHAHVTDAIQFGEFGNPVVDAKIPKGLPSGDMHAYSLTEIQKMLAELGEPVRTAVLVAALTGLRVSEIRGLRWEDFRDGKLFVSRSVWNGHVSDTKTASSFAAVPVLPIVAAALEDHRQRTAGEWVFPGERLGRPIRFENLLNRDIRPALARAGVKWHGWHAFRRGLGTNLYELGAPDKIVQAILRHANVATTMMHYVKPVAAETTAAMKRLEEAFNKAEVKRTA